MTQMMTIQQGRADVFAVVYLLWGIHRHPRLLERKPMVGVGAGSAGRALYFGGVPPNASEGLTLRPDRGSNYMSEDFQNEIICFGMVSSPVFVRQPEGNGVVERAIRTLKEQLLWVRHFETVEELRTALAEFAAQYNASWLRQPHGYKTPDNTRAEQKGLEADAATVIVMVP